MPRGGLGLDWLGLAPSLMNGIGARPEHLGIGVELKFLMTTSSTFPISSSTLLPRGVRDLGQAQRICWRDPLTTKISPPAWNM